MLLFIACICIGVGVLRSTDTDKEYAYFIMGWTMGSAYILAL